ncbi:MAG: dihydrolipoamide acetyltransferase family protein [Verrucomicrobia bacterium]|nr:dihydrolipoamide acetyltransferase family protein [Verrucomicrobiota bacterium]MDA1086183.1 dihydrolipoamide acetyltransferase family protein [Verrucomicrobiota bacterium]
MATAIIMPRQGQSVESCILVEWLVAKGDAVSEGQPIANIETDKATFEVEAPEAGTILELFFEPGDDIPVLTNIAALGADGDDAASLRPDGASAASSDPAPAQAAAAQAAESAVATAPQAQTAGGGSSSPRARAAAARAGLDISTIVGTGPGGRVVERDVLAAAAAQPHLSVAAREAVRSGSAHAETPGSGPGGMVLSADLKAGPAAPAVASGATTEIPVKGIRKIIAQRMKESLSSTAQLTLNRSFDATKLLALRKSMKALEAQGGPKITLNDMIVYATMRTLTQHADLNAHFLGDKIVQYGDVNMGVAVDTPRGLIVPVIRGANQKSLTEISNEIKRLAEAAQAGKISSDDLGGGTFTITTLGALGIETFTPVLNTPEVAILGVGGLFVKPVRVGDAVAYVDAMHLSLTIDHQAVDGAPGARFLTALAESLENFATSG